MKKLTYTNEMMEQDKLWEDSKEDIYLMMKLFNDIMEETTNKGFKGAFNIEDYGNEAILDIFDNEKEKELARLGEIETTMFGYCKPAINYLEKYCITGNRI